MSISERILRRKRLDRIFVNHLSRWLVCDFDIVKKTVNYSKDEIKKFLPEHQKEFRLEGVSDDDLFEKAKGKLLECVFFGLVEKYEESLFLLHYTFGWKPIRDETRLNVDPKKTSADEITTEARELLTKRTEADRKLYEFAKDLFEYRYNLMIKNLKNEFFESKYQEMDEKDAICDMLEKHYQTHYKEWNTKVSSIDYKFNDPPHGIGWNITEKIKTGNHFFRWTGPENYSTIDFPIETNSDLKIQFHVLMWMSEEILDSLKLFVNGTQIPVKKSDSLFTRMAKLEGKLTSPLGKGKNVFIHVTGLGGVFFEGAIPLSILKKNSEFTRIAFETVRTISPKSIHQKSGDDRKLGLGFDWIRIFPEKMND